MSEAIVCFAIGLVGMCVIGFIIWCFNEAEKGYWTQRKQQIQQEDEGCRAHGGFVFTGPNGRECVMGVK